MHIRLVSFLFSICDIWCDSTGMPAAHTHQINSITQCYNVSELFWQLSCSSISCHVCMCTMCITSGDSENDIEAFLADWDCRQCRPRQPQLRLVCSCSLSWNIVWTTQHEHLLSDRHHISWMHRSGLCCVKIKPADTIGSGGDQNPLVSGVKNLTKKAVTKYYVIGEIISAK